MKNLFFIATLVALTSTPVYSQDYFQTSTSPSVTLGFRDANGGNTGYVAKFVVKAPDGSQSDASVKMDGADEWVDVIYPLQFAPTYFTKTGKYQWRVVVNGKIVNSGVFVYEGTAKGASLYIPRQ